MFNKTELNFFYKYCVALSRDEQIACDLLQSSLEKLVRRPITKEKQTKAYFLRMIKNEYIDGLRKSEAFKSESFDEEVHVAEIGPNALDDLLISKEEVKLILENTSLEESEMLFLWAVEGFTIEEIAEFFEKPKGTILAKLFRLRAKLKAILSRGRVESERGGL